MSNAVFPTLPGIAWNIQRTPTFKSERQEAVSGRELGFTYQPYPKYEFKLEFEFLRAGSVGELQSLVAFYLQRGGSFDSFLFKDWSDNAVTNMSFGVGDGGSRSFQLTRAYGANGFFFSEPVQNLNGRPTILFNGSPANLVQNSSFESKTSGRPYGFNPYNSGNISVSLIEPTGRTGGLAYGLKANATTTSTFGVYGTNALVEGGYTGGVIGGWQAGKTYTISFYAKKVNGAGWSGMQLHWSTAPATTTAISNPSLTTAYQRYEFRITWGGAVEGEGKFYLSVPLNATVANDEIHIDDLQIVEASSAPAYVDGEQTYTVGSTGMVTFDFAPAAGDVLSWTGNFYYRCRFSKNKEDFKNFMQDLWEAKSLELIGAPGNLV